MSSLLCRLLGHQWGEALTESRWWICGRCGKDQWERARLRGEKPTGRLWNAEEEIEA